MAKYRYIGECRSGFVHFKHPHLGECVMKQNEAVEVPEWVEARIRDNSHYERVAEPTHPEVVGQDKAVTSSAPIRRGRSSKAE